MKRFQTPIPYVTLYSLRPTPTPSRVKYFLNGPQAITNTYVTFLSLHIALKFAVNIDVKTAAGQNFSSDESDEFVVWRPLRRTYDFRYGQQKYG